MPKKKQTRVRRLNLQNPNSLIIGLGQVMEIVPLSKSTLYVMIQKGEFPAARKIGPRTNFWVKEEVMDWLKKKIK